MQIVLPLGDSITSGQGVTGGYRAPLERLLLASRVEFAFAGRRADNSGIMQFPCHEGYPGYGTGDLREEVAAPALSLLIPDLILLHVGTNDLRSVPSAGIAVARLEKLLTAIFEQLPRVHVCCATLIPVKDPIRAARTRVYNGAVHALTETFRAQGRSVERVKMHRALTVDDLKDGTHPNQTGYDKMAQVWFEAIQQYLRDDNPSGSGLSPEKATAAPADSDTGLTP